MTCRSIMISSPAVLHCADTVGKAASILLDTALPGLPVVDDDGILLGVLTRHRLLGLVLPRVATLDIGIEDLSFLRETLDDLSGRWQEVAGEPIRLHLDLPPVATPDTSLSEALLLLYRGEAMLPVVENKGGKLAGIVSARHLLSLLAGGRD
ncbi:MAG: CBS domain-containing protein [Rhodospirillales bacterium]|nr:CBS domain-containing protein [Rhodospirillales bacterium]